MRETSHRKIAGVELTIVRPWLSVWRREIDAYAKTHQLKFREDASNAALVATRNRLRHRILPYIEKQLRREVRGSIWRAAQLLAEDEDWLAQQAAAEGPDTERLSVRTLRVQPIALQRRIIHRWLRDRDVAEVDYDVVERVRALLAPAASVARINLSRGRHVRRRAGNLFIE